MTQPATTAPGAQDILEQVKQKLGFVPNLFREMSVNPAVLQVYLRGQDTLTNGVLTPQEQHAVQLTVAAANRCEYCQSAHTAIGKQVGISPEDIEHIRAGALPADQQLATIVDTTRLVMDRKGWLDETAVHGLEQRGVTRAKLFEVVAFIGLKTISNYVNHIAHTRVDAEFST